MKRMLVLGILVAGLTLLASVPASTDAAPHALPSGFTRRATGFGIDFADGHGV